MDFCVKNFPSERFTRGELSAMPWLEKGAPACRPFTITTDYVGKIVVIVVDMATGSVHYVRPIVLTNRRDQERMMRGE